MTKYTVQAGRHDFKPNDQCFITAKIKIEGAFRMDESMWFSQEDPDYPGGDDVQDWNKIVGLTWFFSSNSNRSALLVWRPNEKMKGAFEIAAYVNPNTGRFQATKLGNVHAGDIVKFQVVWATDVAVFKMKRDSSADWTWAELPLKRPPFWGRIYRQLGPWFGGNQAAHKEMTLFLDLK